MKRIALLFALIVTASAAERIVLPVKFSRVVEARARMRRAWVTLAQWRDFLIGRWRLFQHPKREPSQIREAWKGVGRLA
jgi:hypothetical protein